MRWKSIFEHRPLTTILLVNVLFALALCGLLEWALRYYTSYNIGYYTAIRASNEISYPYGKIPVNSLGYVDEEFDLKSTKPRVGYVGDSVIFGLGAGYPYRISEIVQDQYPSMEHWNISLGIGADMDEDEIIKRARDLRLDLVVYVMNLNDIAPTVRQVEERDVGEKTIWSLRIIEKDYLSWLRGKSYLYNFVRTRIKNLLQRLGYQETGVAAVEFWPSDNKDVLAKFAERVIDMDHRLESLGTQFCMLIVPYEMQVSVEAEKTYANMGFTWEDGFERGLTQDLLMRDLPGIQIYDAREAFDRERARIGEYFVYNKGDKIDWNHPNRKGHERIARGFIESHTCVFLSQSEERAHGNATSGSARLGGGTHRGN